MNITINGEINTISTGTTAADLLSELGLIDKRLALEVNQDIVSRSQYTSFELRADDKVEIVHAIGGG
ncbi:MAG: sulfur carrier protein ThiS [Thiohalomonadales bacterium]